MAFKTAGMVTQYAHSINDGSTLDPASGLTVGAGAASIIAAFMVNPLAGIAAGAATIGAGAVATLSSTSSADLKFATYTELGDKADSIRNAVTNSLDNFFNTLFLHTPPTDPNWVTKPIAIPRMLHSGSFASVSSLSTESSLMPSNADLRKFVAAPLINQLWLKDLIIIAKIDNKSIFVEGGDEYHPCDNNGTLTENHDSSDFKFCNPDGSAFLLV
jgi:p-aminobenzoyl-glutamate transporter AbgT